MSSLESARHGLSSDLSSLSPYSVTNCKEALNYLTIVVSVRSSAVNKHRQENDRALQIAENKLTNQTTGTALCAHT
ncbi:hypothetical protein IQ272_33050 [Chroococcidiopsidales cyanobacterium LEGE 13417]|nr:hypothetical protein [Chroococcidiopsidales cyanobacterium LEGE 13417]